MSLAKSKAMAWSAMLLVVVVVIVAIATRFATSIWEYGALFLIFMSVFCHLAALMLYRMSAVASKKLDMAALIFGILAILAFIAIFIVNFCAFY